jgi:hemerythrin-like domain-containing protein
MSSTHDSTDLAGTSAYQDGFDVLDECHRQTLFTLTKLTALVSRLASFGLDAEAREMATEIVHFFSTTARQHQHDEERHVFPKLVSSGDPEIVKAVLRLQQDHEWLEEDWMEFVPQLDAVAGGRSWYELGVLREGVEAFAALWHDHIVLEESCIYPQARAQLSANERCEMGREMAARRRAQRAANVKLRIV